MKGKLYVLKVMAVIFFITVFATASHVLADDVILYPGYITGTVTVEGFDDLVSNISIGAYGNGHYASNSASGDSYALTVNGGDWDYKVSCSVYFNHPTTTSMTMFFNDRYFPVSAGENVLNDYTVDPGIVTFHLNITGLTYDTWSAVIYAVRPAAGYGEESHAYVYTKKQKAADGIWVMPVDPNEHVRIYGYVEIDGKRYYVPNTVRAIAAGENIDLDLNIVHTLPSTSISGLIDLRNIENFQKHLVQMTDGSGSYYGYSTFVNQNPGYYQFNNVEPGGHRLLQTTYMDNGRTFLIWPATGDGYGHETLNIQPGMPYIKDFAAETGTLITNLRFSGTMDEDDIGEITMRALGIQAIYTPGMGYVLTPTNQGSAYTTNSTYYHVSDLSRLRLFLSPGPWGTSEFTVWAYNDDYTKTNYINLTDLNYYYTGQGSQNFGQNVSIVPGTTTTIDREYCTGSVKLRLIDGSGGLISNPSVGGSGRHYRADGKIDMYVNISGSSKVTNAVAPEIEVHGPPANYVLRAQANIANGSNVTFGTAAVTLECGVRKGMDMSGPVITLLSPPAGLISNNGFVTVSGKATDDTGISEITINGISVPFTSAGNASDPNQVLFSHSLAVNTGNVTITTTAVDNSGRQAYDERTVCIDRVFPSVTVSPSDGSIYPAGMQIPVSVQANDMGCGFSLKVYADGELLCETTGPQNSTSTETTSCSSTLLSTSADQVITALVSDIAGNSVNGMSTIRKNTSPVITIGGPYTVGEGGSIAISVSGSDPEGGPLTYEWDLDGNGTFETSGSIATFSAGLLDGPHNYTISARVTDNGGLFATGQTSVHVLNITPAISTVPDSVIREGETFSAGGSFSDPGPDTWTATVDYGDGSGVQPLPLSGNSFTLEHMYADNGVYAIAVTVTDDDGGLGTANVNIVVNNAVPSIGDIAAPIGPRNVTLEIGAVADFTDAGVMDTHAALWDWDDGTTSEGIVTEINGSGSVSGNHVYTNAGVYTISLTLTDKDGGAAQAVFHYIVVYDPAAGFVTGGGWINSPAGAYTTDPLLTGKASFGFVAKYKNGASTPSGQTEFNFKVADMNFRSYVYEWLVVAGPHAKYKGSGTINNSGDYRFMLTATDGQVSGGGIDSFRIKIWDKATDAIIYDNQMGDDETADATYHIGSGSIVIHK